MGPSRRSLGYEDIPSKRIVGLCPTFQPPFCVTLSGWGAHVRAWCSHHDVLPSPEAQTNRNSQSWTSTTRTMSQNKPHNFINILWQLFHDSDRTLTNTMLTFDLHILALRENYHPLFSFFWMKQSCLNDFLGDFEWAIESKSSQSFQEMTYMKLQEQDTEGLLLQQIRIFQAMFTLNTFPKNLCVEITVFQKH